jgi:hypothetical protein
MSQPYLNWPRWIRASINDYFAGIATTRELPFLVEGIDETESETIRATNHVELRVGGPSTISRSGDFHLRVGINLLFTGIMGEQLENPYDIIEHVAAFQVAMHDPIPIYKYGEGPDDDGSHLGCLALVSGRNELVESYDFGQVGKEERVRQLMLDARYYIDLVP